MLVFDRFVARGLQIRSLDGNELEVEQGSVPSVGDPHRPLFSTPEFRPVVTQQVTCETQGFDLRSIQIVEHRALKVEILFTILDVEIISRHFILLRGRGSTMSLSRRRHRPPSMGHHISIGRNGLKYSSTLSTAIAVCVDHMSVTSQIRPAPATGLDTVPPKNGPEYDVTASYPLSLLLSSISIDWYRSM